MSEINKDAVAKQLAGVTDPISGKDIIAAGLLGDISIAENNIRIILQIKYEERARQAPLAGQVESLLKKAWPQAQVEMLLTAERTPEPGTPAAAKPALWNLTPLPHVKRVIGVASGKGGVGKSTIVSGLAMTLAASGKRVGLLDADLQGPSLPRLFGLKEKPVMKEGMVIPPTAHGVKCLSLGLLVGDEPAVMRGPMVSKTLHQFLRGTAWGSTEAPLDTLFIDLPPGTGDIHLTLLQQLDLSHGGGGVIIVTTPQGIAVDDAWKCVRMFQKIDSNILGIIENMSFLALPDGSQQPVFGEGGGETLSQRSSAQFLGKIPLLPTLNQTTDLGQNQTHGEAAKYYYNILKILS